MLGVSPRLDRLEIVVAEDALNEDHVRRVAFEVKARLESAGHVVRDVSVPPPGEHIHAGQMNSLTYEDGTHGNAFPVVGLPPDTDMVDFPLAEGRWLASLKTTEAYRHEAMDHPQQAPGGRRDRHRPRVPGLPGRNAALGDDPGDAPHVALALKFHPRPQDCGRFHPVTRSV